MSHHKLPYSKAIIVWASLTFMKVQILMCRKLETLPLHQPASSAQTFLLSYKQHLAATCHIFSTSDQNYFSFLEKMRFSMKEKSQKIKVSVEDFGERTLLKNGKQKEVCSFMINDEDQLYEDSTLYWYNGPVIGFVRHNHHLSVPNIAPSHYILYFFCCLRLFSIFMLFSHYLNLKSIWMFFIFCGKSNSSKIESI